jgi:hypothetical protein
MAPPVANVSRSVGAECKSNTPSGIALPWSALVIKV